MIIVNDHIYLESNTTSYDRHRRDNRGVDWAAVGGLCDGEDMEILPEKKIVFKARSIIAGMVSPSWILKALRSRCRPPKNGARFAHVRARPKGKDLVFMEWINMGRLVLFAPF